MFHHVYECLPTGEGIVALAEGRHSQVAVLSQEVHWNRGGGCGDYLHG